MKSNPQTFDVRIARGKRCVVLLLLAGIAVMLTGCAGGVRNTSRTFTTVVIDAGHGGHDRGATSRSGLREKDLCLDVARRLEPKLRAAGFQTVLTRKGDYFVPLDQRARVSNRQSNSIFVSIHFNHARRRTATGAEVFYRSRPSRDIARKVLTEMVALPGVDSRGVKTANFRVLKRNQFPAVLVECGFLSNPGEASRCASSMHRERLASAIATGIITQRYGRRTPVLTPSVAAN